MKYNNDLTAEYVRECLDYDRESGLLTWKARPREHFKSDHGWKQFNEEYPGKNAGGINIRDGYVTVGINGKSYKVHRLAWLIAYGEWPKNQIDHADGIRHNNSISNLSDVTPSQNLKNKSLGHNNTSGCIGVYLTKEKTWRVRIRVNQKNLHIGTFKNKKDAFAARHVAEINYGYHSGHGKILEKSYGN